MPKYYCDYCDAFLTHDSPSVRKTHNGGKKHKDNVRQFYQKWMEEQAQKLVDATARAFVTQRGPGGRPLLPAGQQLRPSIVPNMGAPMPAMGRGFMPPMGMPGKHSYVDRFGIGRGFQQNRNWEMPPHFMPGMPAPGAPMNPRFNPYQRRV